MNPPEMRGSSMGHSEWVRNNLKLWKEQRIKSENFWDVKNFKQLFLTKKN
jgi:hypothetical protein